MGGAGESGGRKMETTLFKQQDRKEKIKNSEVGVGKKGCWAAASGTFDSRIKSQSSQLCCKTFHRRHFPILIPFY